MNLYFIWDVSSCIEIESVAQNNDLKKLKKSCALVTCSICCISGCLLVHAQVILATCMSVVFTTLIYNNMEITWTDMINYSVAKQSTDKIVSIFIKI